MPFLKLFQTDKTIFSSFTDSDRFNIYALSDQMKSRGWNLNALQFPQSVHLCVTMLHTQEGLAEKFVKDVREITKMILDEPEKHKGGSVAIYGEIFNRDRPWCVL